MSSFRIYQIDQFDPKTAGQNLRRQIIILVSLIPIIVLIFGVLLAVIKISLAVLLVFFIPIVGFYIFHFIKIGSKIRNLKTIGEIEFTRTSIRKKIGDSLTEYDFQIIKKIELQKHLPFVGISGTLSENVTYILNLNFLNSSSESLVVSNLPIDPRLNTSIIETMKTLKKIIESEITIET